MKNSLNISTTTYGELKENGPYELALLPWGATEAHNGPASLLPSPTGLPR